MRSDLLIVLPVVFVVVCWLIGPAWCGWGWELTEGEPGSDGTTRPAAGRSVPALAAVSPSESSWPALPDGWTPADVELTLMDIEYAEAYRG